MNLDDINLEEYKLVRPESIIKEDNIKKFYDISIEDDKTFYILGENDFILSHNCDGNCYCCFINKLFL